MTRRPSYREPAHLHALEDAYVKCRTIGHSWDDFSPMLRPAQFGDRLSFLCVSCTTKRYDIVSWIDGSLLDRQYDHPEGYRLTEKTSRQEFRMAYVARRKKEARRQEREAVA